MNTTQIHYLWSDPRAARRFRTGVSLHSHTMHSRESMAFLPHYAYQVPLLGRTLRRQERLYLERWGCHMDYSRCHWTPPLPAREAFQLERRQIEEQLDLAAFVSVTDHDEMEACFQLQVIEQARAIPVSVEWTVPLGPSFLHLGLHNLPAGQAKGLMHELAGYTLTPCNALLGQLLERLHAYPEALIVLNHAFWDEMGIGAASHLRVVQEFLQKYGRWLHALELNGMRPWKENRDVIELARAWDYPLVSGGDRHGCEPNANLNVTNAGTFEEFVAEIRVARMSDVLFMPQYRESYRSRVVETVWDILRDYPEHAGRTRWTDRVFYRSLSRTEQPLSALWKRDCPAAARLFMGALCVFEHRRVRSALRLALADRQEMA